MNPNIFREYDIRGIVEKDFNFNDVERIGRGYATYLRQHGGRSCVVGYDCRLSSPEISKALIKGLIRGGTEVIDVGLCPTPVFYFALRYFNTNGGLMITASHNPPEYNGFKVCLGPDTIFGKEIQRFRKVIDAGDYASGRGNVGKHEIVTPYCNYLVNNINITRPVKLAIDAGNGTGGLVTARILERMQCNFIKLFIEPDGNFPNHEPDPTIPDNLKILTKTVCEKGLELGIAFDGDADRLGVVDEKGKIIYGDMLMVLFTRDILRDHPGAKFIGEVKCSQIMYDDIESHGGKPIMWKTGHSLIKQKLKDEQALLAGEMSGHFFFRHRYFGFDDGIYAACRLLEIVSRDKKPLSEYFSHLPKTYNTPEIRVDCPEDQKFQLVDEVRTILSKDYKVISIDGARLVFPDGWGLVRASNTSPVLVLRFEAYSESRLQEIRNLVERVIDEAKISLSSSDTVEVPFAIGG